MNGEVFVHYGVHLVPEEKMKEVIDSMLPKFISIKPPEGVILILEVDGYAVGMGRLNRLENNIGEVNNMYIRPEYRRRGYASQMLSQLEEKAIDFGYSTLRLETHEINRGAQNLYRKAGYKEIERYTKVRALENEKTRLYYKEKVYMEKKL